MEDYQRLATKENKELLSSTLNMIEDLEKDNNFTRLMSDIIKTKDGYAVISPCKLSNLLELSISDDAVFKFLFNP